MSGYQETNGFEMKTGHHEGWLSDCLGVLLFNHLCL